MNTTAYTDQLAAHLRDARCCDALDPCINCRNERAEVVAFRHAARVEAAKVPTIPAPRTGDLQARLMAARS